MRRIFIIFLSFLSLAAYSQTNTYSPYSRYGLGELSKQGLAANRSMGGTGIALRIPNHLNYLNPASYTTQDTLSFIFDFGVYSNFTNFKSLAGSSSDMRSSLNHIVIGFPITKWWKTSIGLVPYSRMGYDVLKKGSGLIDYTYKGTGGLNKFYAGSGFKMKDLSVGFNFNVIFGSLEQNHSYYHLEDLKTKFYPTQRFQQQSIRSVSFTFGLQYDLKINDDFSMTVGGVFENKSRMTTENLLLVTNTFTVTDTLINPVTGEYYGKRSSIDTINYSNNKVRNNLPVRYGAGITLNYKNKLLVSADYSSQKWSDYSSFNPFDNLVDSRYLNFGLQFTPDEKAIRSYWKRVNFRAGYYTSDSYIKVNGHPITDSGFTFGMRLPFKGYKSAFQLSYEYGKRGTTDFNLIQENYHLINLSITLYDFWFVKSKYD